MKGRGEHQNIDWNVAIAQRTKNTALQSSEENPSFIKIKVVYIIQQFSKKLV